MVNIPKEEPLQDERFRNTINFVQLVLKNLGYQFPV